MKLRISDISPPQPTNAKETRVRDIAPDLRESFIFFFFFASHPIPFLCAVCTCLSTASSVRRRTDRLPHIRPEFTCLLHIYAIFERPYIYTTTSAAPTSSRYFVFSFFLSARAQAYRIYAAAVIN
jgi:hypothetical protein